MFDIQRKTLLHLISRFPVIEKNSDFQPLLYQKFRVFQIFLSVTHQACMLIFQSPALLKEP